MLSEEARGSSNGTGLASDSLLGQTRYSVSVYTGPFRTGNTVNYKTVVL